MINHWTIILFYYTVTSLSIYTILIYKLDKHEKQIFLVMSSLLILKGLEGLIACWRIEMFSLRGKINTFKIVFYSEPIKKARQR